jgi:hypothetical protein
MQPDTYTLTIDVPRELIDQAIAGAEATVTVEAVIERIAGMHRANLSEDIKWAVHDIAEDPGEVEHLQPFRVVTDDDGEYVEWLEMDGSLIESEGPFGDQAAAAGYAVSRGGRQVSGEWPG